MGFKLVTSNLLNLYTAIAPPPHCPPATDSFTISPMTKFALTDSFNLRPSQTANVKESPQTIADRIILSLRLMTFKSQGSLGGIRMYRTFNSKTRFRNWFQMLENIHSLRIRIFCSLTKLLG